MCFENVRCKAFIFEEMGFGMAPKCYKIHSKPQSLLQKTFIFHAFETLATYAGMCLRMHALARVHRLLRTYVGQGLLWFFISKNRFLCICKSDIFHFNTPKVNLKFDWALNWPWALEFEHHWGNRGPSRKGYKIQCLQGSKVRSSELEMGLSSNDDTIRTEIDTTSSVPSPS